MSLTYKFVSLLLCGVGVLSCSDGNDPEPTVHETPGLQSILASPPPELEELAARLRDAPDDLDALRLFARRLHASGQREESLFFFRRIVELQPDTESLIDIGLTYGSLGHLDQAEQSYQRALAGSPNNSLILHNLGNLAYQRGRYAQATQFYNQAVTHRPDYLLAWYHLGDAFRMGEKFHDAYRCYEQVLDLNARDQTELDAVDDALYRLGALDLQMGDTERARTFLTELVELNPEHPRAHYALGQALLQLNRIAEAEEQLRIHQDLLDARPYTTPAAIEE